MTPARRGAPLGAAARRVAGPVLGLLVLAFLAYALANGWTRVRRYDWRLEPGWLVLGVGILLAFYALGAVSYLRIVRMLHEPSTPSRAAASAWARSLLGRYVPGNVMMVVGRAVLAARLGVPRRVTLAAMTYEQALGLATAAAASLAFLALYGDLGHPELVWLVLVVAVCLLALLHPRIFRPLSTWALARVRREPLTVFLSTRQVAGFAGWYGLMTVMLGTGVWALVRSAAGPPVGGPAFAGLGFLAAFTVAMLAFVFPSGLGVRDGIFALALAQRLPGSVAVALSVGTRFALVVVEVVFVGATFLWGRRP